MPTYEYYCSDPSCGHEFECFQSMKDAALSECPKCGKSTLKRKIGTGAGIIFKGSGFYETDYKRKSASNASPINPTPKNDAASTPSTATSEPAKASAKAG